MNLGDFTISGVKVEKANSGYTLSLGAFESTAESASGTPLQLQVKVWKVRLRPMVKPKLR